MMHYLFYVPRAERNMPEDSVPLIVYKFVSYVPKFIIQRNVLQYFVLKLFSKEKLRQVKLNLFVLLLKDHGKINNRIWLKVLILNHMHNHIIIGLDPFHGNLGPHNLKIHLGLKVSKILMENILNFLCSSNHILVFHHNFILLIQLNFLNFKIQVNKFHHRFLKNPINYLHNHLWIQTIKINKLFIML